MRVIWPHKQAKILGTNGTDAGKSVFKFHFFYVNLKFLNH